MINWCIIRSTETFVPEAEDLPDSPVASRNTWNRMLEDNQSSRAAPPYRGNAHDSFDNEHLSALTLDQRVHHEEILRDYHTRQSA